MGDHFIEKCRHGTVVTQCRCPSPNKRITVVPCPERCSRRDEPVVGKVQDPVSVRSVDVDEFREKAAVLMVEHHSEVVLRRDVQRLNPNWPKYYELELRGELAILAGWAGAKMVGYSMNFWYDHLHDVDLRIFLNDGIFVTKAHRGSGLGKMLLESTEDAARLARCQIISTHAKPGSTLARMLGGAGFKGEPSQALLPGWYVSDIVFSKVL